MTKAATIIREYGPFPGVESVAGVSYDGKNVWFASGDKLNAHDHESGETVRSLDNTAHAATAFDGRHLFQIAEERIQKIDPGLYEAVRLDGGGAIREFFTVTLPQLRGEIAVAATLTVISALASFDVVYIMTRGGPGTQTMVPGVEIYNQAFTNGRVGQASALAIVLSLMVYLVVILINGLAREKK